MIRTPSRGASNADRTGEAMEPTYLLAKAIIKPTIGPWLNWNIEGLENIPGEGGAILAVNHISYLDPLVAAYVVDRAKRRPRFLAKSELFDDKRISWILRGAGQIPVKRGTAHAPMALDQAINALNKGEVVVIFPEGTITTDPDLHPMAAKSGVARLALSTGVPVIPMALWGTANIWPKGFRKHWWPPGQDVLVRIGKTLQIAGSADDPSDWDRVGETVMNAISSLLAGLRPAVPDRRRPKKTAA
jgi:1-acyl-sn-glycerol-3-phosphate acyltransferase